MSFYFEAFLKNFAPLVRFGRLHTLLYHTDAINKIEASTKKGKKRGKKRFFLDSVLNALEVEQPEKSVIFTL